MNSSAMVSRTSIDFGGAKRSPMAAKHLLAQHLLHPGLRDQSSANATLNYQTALPSSNTTPIDSRHCGSTFRTRCRQPRRGPEGRGIQWAYEEPLERSLRWGPESEARSRRTESV